MTVSNIDINYGGPFPISCKWFDNARLCEGWFSLVELIALPEETIIIARESYLV